MTAENSLRRAEELMERLEQTRAKLEATTDPDTAIEVLSDLAQIAKEVQAALSEAKSEADADA